MTELIVIGIGAIVLGASLCLFAYDKGALSAAIGHDVEFYHCGKKCGYWFARVGVDKWFGPMWEGATARTMTVEELREAYPDCVARMQKARTVFL